MRLRGFQKRVLDLQTTLPNPLKYGTKSVRHGALYITVSKLGLYVEGQTHLATPPRQYASGKPSSQGIGGNFNQGTEMALSYLALVMELNSGSSE